MYGISYDIYNSSDFGIVDLTPYQKVIISSYQSQTFYNSLDGNVSWFESYAAGGGILEVHACDSIIGAYWHGSYLMPGGLDVTPLLLNDVDINIAQHPFIINPHAINDTAIDSWSSSAHGYFDTFPLDSREILQHTGTSNPILLEFTFGKGYIIASMQTLEYAYGNGFPGGKILENIILHDPSGTFFTDTLTVGTPNSLSSWHTGTSHDIEWVTTGNVSNVKIELYRGGVFELEITANITNDGEFSWSIPLSVIDSTQYQIKVTDVSNALTYDYSQYFEIYNPTITVTAPGISTYTTCVRGSENTISWTSTGIITNVKIELFLNDTFVLEIIASTTNDGDYSWLTPSDLDPSTLYQIKITDSSNALIYDFSVYFEITIPSNGGSPPGIPGYNLVIFIASLVGVSILLLKKKLKTK
jgi:hypothetical protein